MIRVVFEAGPGGPALETAAPAGARLLDVCDAAAAPVPFSCRDARCGSCLIEVLAGLELLEAPELDELETLRSIGARAAQRLACQARFAMASGLLRLRPAKIT